jgi:hypothetical protein
MLTVLGLIVIAATMVFSAGLIAHLWRQSRNEDRQSNPVHQPVDHC